MPNVQLMTVSRRGNRALEYDIRRDSDNAILISGLQTPFTTETGVPQWQALCVADAPAARDARVAILNNRKAALQSQIDAINAQIADLSGTIT